MEYPHLDLLVKWAVNEFADEVDPDEKKYPSAWSLDPLRAELKKAVEAAIEDWKIEQRKEPHHV